jgi:biofilm PGA synthesis protein PgaA
MRLTSLPNSFKPKATLLVLTAALAGSAFAGNSGVADVYAAASNGLTDKALALADGILNEQPRNADVREARAFVLRGQARYAQALMEYRRLLSLDPHSRAGIQGAVLCLRALGKSLEAQQIARQAPEMFGKAEMMAIGLEAAAELVRQGENDRRVGERAFERTDSALQAYESLVMEHGLASADDLPASGPSDRIVALFNRRLLTDAIHAFEAQQARGRKMPHYAVLAAARSYVSLNRPEKTVALLEPDRDRLAADAGYVRILFYAFIDTEQHARARQLIADALVKAPDNPTFKTLNAWSFAFDEQLEKAEQHFQENNRAAPSIANDEALGMLAMWQGFPRKAQAHYGRALAAEPGSISVRRSIAELHFSRGDERAGRSALQRLQAEDPWDERVRKIARDRALREGPSISLQGGRAISHATSAQVARETVAQFRLNGPLQNDFWRLFATFSHVNAFSRGQDVTQGQTGAGIAMTAKDKSGAVALVRNRHSRTGVTATASYSPFDSIVLSAEAETLTTDIAARAAAEDIDGQRAAAAVQWRPDYRRSFVINASRTFLSDDNITTNAGLKWLETWYRNSRYGFRTTAAWSGFRAARQDVAYFSPSRRSVAGITWALSALESRQAWLGKSRWHHLELDTALVEQDGFSSGRSGALRYRLDWAMSPGFTAGLTLERARLIYDGDAEMRNAFYMSFSAAL